MKFKFKVETDIFILLPCVAFGRVGEDAERGVVVAWLFFFFFITDK